jgi:MarR family transcriptional regulator, 2-MHQ and catechol-resistance regulon repressor
MIVSGETHQGGSSAGSRKLGKPTQRARKVRAYRLYVDLLETGEYMRRELKGQMEAFGLTTAAFRVLELLYGEGAMALPTVWRKLGSERRNMRRLVKKLEARGLVEARLGRLPAADYDESQLAKSRRGLPRRGREVAFVRLTKQGEKFVGEILPRHMKLVLAVIRTLDWREQQTLSAICKKLRAGDAYRFLEEMQWEDVD